MAPLAGEGRWSRSWVIGVLVGTLAKLLLVANREIVPAAGLHDDYWQILSASYWHWWRPYDVWTLMHLPVYPWFIAVTGSIGLSLRLSMELCYIGGAAALSAALGRLGLVAPLRLVAFALIVFHPYSFTSFDYALAEMFYACLLIYFVALFICVIAPRTFRDLRLNAGLFALTTALAWHCRKESVLIGGVLSFVAVGILAAYVFGALTRASALRSGLVLVAIPLGAAFALGVIISTANGFRYGLWETNQMVAKNFVRAYSSLLAIRPDHPIRFVPVSRDTRQKAYAVSPAFRELEPIFDGPREFWYMVESKRWLGYPGEIGAGWFYWALVDAAAAAGHFTTAPEAEAYFGRVADEIGAAVKDGRVPSRRVVLPYVDPSLALWLPYLPSSAVKIAATLWPSVPPFLPGRPETVALDVMNNYDSVAQRRAASARGERVFAEGWVLSASSRPVRVEVVDRDGRLLTASFQSQPRPDVQEAIRTSPTLGFAVEWAAAYALDVSRLSVVLEGGTSAVSAPLSTVKMSHRTRLQAATGSDEVVYIVLDRLTVPAPSVRNLVTNFVTRWYTTVLGLVAVAAAAYSIVVLVAGRVTVASAATVSLLFVLAVIVTRLAFFSVLDASSWTGNQVRYLFSVATLAAVVPVMVFAIGRKRLPPFEDHGLADFNAGHGAVGSELVPSTGHEPAPSRRPVS